MIYRRSLTQTTISRIVSICEFEYTLKLPPKCRVHSNVIFRVMWFYMF